MLLEENKTWFVWENLANRFLVGVEFKFLKLR